MGLKISKETTGLSNKPMQPNFELFKQVKEGKVQVAPEVLEFLHLVRGKLVSVYKTEAEQPANSNWASFSGYTIPSLHFRFESIDVNTKDTTVYTHTLSCVDPHQTFKNSGKPSADSGVRSIYTYVAHFTSVCLGGVDLEFNVPVTDKGRLDLAAYRALETEEVIRLHNEFFDSVINAFYTTAKGKEPVLNCVDTDLNIKLTIQPYNNNAFGFNSFGPGTGVIERYIKGMKHTSLKLDVIKGETIIPIDNSAQVVPDAAPNNEIANILERLP